MRFGIYTKRWSTRLSGKDLLSALIQESKSYASFNDLEQLVESHQSLAALPVQPLYLSLKRASQELVAETLPKLSQEQRLVLLDIELWHKDEVNAQQFHHWPEIYAKCKDLEVVQEFAQTTQFLLYLKASFNVYTFDEEDPQYPDHDYFFLTDDNLLLFEYSSELDNVKEVQFIIKNIYAALGVEKAYALLFKTVVNSYSVFQEEAYQEKKERLRDYGFVDYYEALNLRATFPTDKKVDAFIKNKLSSTGNIDPISENQVLHSQAVMAFQNGLETFSEELLRVQDDKRKRFLHFDFIRLINANMGLEDSFVQGSMAINKTAKNTRSFLELGFHYVKSRINDQSLFEVFTFWDLFKVGKSLIEIRRKDVKKCLAHYKLDDQKAEKFLGESLNKLIDAFLDEFPKALRENALLEVTTVENLNLLDQQITFLKEFSPFIQKFYISFEDLIDEGLLSDHFYLNYQVVDIDFEAIILSSFMNFDLGHFHSGNQKKMGVTVSELKEFLSHYFVYENQKSEVSELEKLKKQVLNFQQSFGLDVTGASFVDYMVDLMVNQLEGYEFTRLADEEFKHVGGAILLGPGADKS
jgi:hypothetical protein